MDPTILAVVIGATVAVIGFLITYISGKKLAATTLAEAEARAKSVVDDAAKEAQAIKREKLLESKEEIQKQKRQHEQEREQKDVKLKGLEKELKKREEGVESKFEVITKKEKQLASLEGELAKKASTIDGKVKEIDVLVDEQNERLERITGMSRDDAKRFLTGLTTRTRQGA